MQKDQLGERQKLKRLEVLEAVDKARMNLEWFGGETLPKDEDRGQATKDLLQLSLIEKDEDYPGALHPQPFRLTARGRAFLENARARIGEKGNINWQRVNEIEFP